MNVQRYIHNTILNISTKESEYAFWQEYAKHLNMPKNTQDFEYA